MNKDELLKYSNEIKSKADLLLYQKEILNILERFGKVIITGSYSLDLMIKKDLDISLVNDKLKQIEFFELGKLLSEKLNPHGMFYRNTVVKEVPNRPPNSFYWGIQHEEWKIDLWKVPSFYSEESVHYINNIKQSLDEEKKEIILSLKYELMSDNDYGRKFSSKEIYKAVVFNQVKTLEQFLEYVKN